MTLKVGDRVVRKSGYSDEDNEYWFRECRAQGKDPFKVFTVREIQNQGHIFRVMGQIGSTLFLADRFHIVPDKDKKLEDWL